MAETFRSDAEKQPEDLKKLFSVQSRMTRVFYAALFLALLLLTLLYLVWPRVEFTLLFFQGTMVWSVLVMMYAFQRLYSVSGEVKGVLRRQTFLDDVTRIFDHRYLDLRLTEEHERTRRYGGFTSVICLDIDHFDTVNDRFGPRAGDLVLQDLAKRMSRTVRSCDVMGRAGGDEFLVVLPQTDRRQACSVAERLLKTASNYSLDLGEGGCIDFLQASAGVAAYPVNGNTVDDVLAAADHAMGEAKERGGNCMCMAEEFVRSDEEAEELLANVRSESGSPANS